jgi:hypothetical protein
MILGDIIESLKPGVIVRGPVLPEAVRLIEVKIFGSAVKIIGKGLNTGRYYEPILNAEHLAKLEITPERELFDGDPNKFRLGVEALRLALAYEYDPYFSLSIARVDLLPHQLEAVYEYFLKLPRIRFLLADDPGAGKTIMAGSERPGRRDADCLPVGADDCLRRAGLRRGSPADAFALAEQESASLDGFAHRAERERQAC